MEYRDTNQDASNELRSLSIITFLIIITLAILSVSCEDKCETFYSYTTYDPIYTTTQELRDAVEVLDPTIINAPGKIYMLDKYLLINEVGKGIHIINNENNRAPKPVSFINIPGNYDLAGKGNYIYADSYVDLLVFDISNIANIKLVSRVEGVFQNYYNTFGYMDGRGIITEYKERLVEEMIETDCGSGQIFLESNTRPWQGNFSDLRATTSSAGSPTAAGIGGSMARFTITGDQLYTVDYSTLRTFDITDIAKPKAGAVTQIGWGIETIFPYKSNLFLGAQNGMYIFDRANDGSVSLLSKYEHITSCDPVVVQNDIAYVTLRNGMECNGFTISWKSLMYLI
jgi:hypothetical protein